MAEDMTDNRRPDALLDTARRERAKRWLHTDLHGELTLSAEEEIEATLADEPKEERAKKGRPEKT